MRAQWLSFLVLGLALGAGGCGSDYPDDGGYNLGTAGTAGTGTGGTPGTGEGGSAGTGEAGTAGTGEAGTGGTAPVMPVDACITTTELQEAAEAEYTDGDTTDTPGGWAATCGRQCLPDVGTPAYSPCVTSCIMGKTDNALTEDCARCLVIPVECAVIECFSECAADTPECDPCVCSKPEPESCIEQYEKCSGLVSNTCDGI